MSFRFSDLYTSKKGGHDLEANHELPDWRKDSERRIENIQQGKPLETRYGGYKPDTAIKPRDGTPMTRWEEIAAKWENTKESPRQSFESVDLSPTSVTATHPLNDAWTYGGSLRQQRSPGLARLEARMKGLHTTDPDYLNGVARSWTTPIPASSTVATPIKVSRTQSCPDQLAPRGLETPEPNRWKRSVKWAAIFTGICVGLALVGVGTFLIVKHYKHQTPFTLTTIASPIAAPTEDQPVDRIAGTNLTLTLAGT